MEDAGSRLTYFFLKMYSAPCIKLREIALHSGVLFLMQGLWRLGGGNILNISHSKQSSLNINLNM